MNNNDFHIFSIPNCIEEKHQNLLENYVSNPNFAWNYVDGTILKKDIKKNYGCVIEKGINPPQFVHTTNLKNDSNIIFYQPILNFIASHFNTNIQILKFKFNLLTRYTSNTHHYPHSDVDDFENNIKSAIYYVNNSDGDTYFFNEYAPSSDKNLSVMKTLSPKKGSIVIFDSKRFHASSSPVVNDTRIVLNVVFKLHKE